MCNKSNQSFCQQRFKSIIHVEYRSQVVSYLIQILQRFHDKEAYGLIGTLLHDGCREALVDAADALRFDNFPDAMGKALELGIRTALIVDKLHLNCFHGRDRNDGLTHTSPQAA